MARLDKCYISIGVRKRFVQECNYTSNEWMQQRIIKIQKNSSDINQDSEFVV